MAKNPATTLKFYEKDQLSLKNDAELKSKLAAFVAKHDLPADSTSKSLLNYLLTLAETYLPAAEIEARTNSLTVQLEQKIEDLAQFKSGLEKDYQGLQDENATLKLKTESLLAENEGFKQENEELKKPETQNRQWFESLQTLAPHMVKDGDTKPEDSIKRFVFVENANAEEIARLKNAMDDLQRKLVAAQNRPVELGPGEAVISFNAEQLENIRKLRRLLEAMGTQFKNNDPNEVIHAVMANQVDLMMNFTGMLKAYLPIIDLL